MAPSEREQATENLRAVLLDKQRRQELLSRSEIESDYGLSKRWLELAALSGNGPPMVRISARMVRYQRGVLEDWLRARTVNSTSEETDAA